MINRILNNQSSKFSVIGSLFSKFGSAFFAFLSSILMARVMNVSDYGVYIMAFSVATMLSVPTSLGIPLMISRNVSKYVVHNEQSKIKGLIIKSNQLVLVLFIIVVLLASISYWFWWHKYDEMLTDTVWISFVLLFFLSFGSLRNAALNGMKFVILGELPDTFLRNGLLCLFIAIITFFDIDLTPLSAMWLHVIAAMISFAVGHYFLYVKVVRKLLKVEASYDTQYWIKEALPFSINAGINILRQRISTFLLASFSTMSAVAIFDIALRGASLVSFTLDAINKGIAPFISSAFEEKNISKLQVTVSKASRLVFFFSLPVALAFIFGGEMIIEKLYGINYSKSYTPLLILCTGQLFNALAGSVGLVVMMTGHQKYLAKINIVVTIVGALLSVPSIYFYSTLGAAVVTAIMLIVQNFTLYLFTLRNLKVNTLIFNIKKLEK